MKTEHTFIEVLNNQIKKSVTLKLITITILMLLLLIPISMIKSIIAEREALSKDAKVEVSSRWANNQQIIGPILSIPLIYEQEKKEERIQITKYWHLLPEKVSIDGHIEPTKLKRGIYEVAVYKSKMTISGDFNLTLPDTNNLKEIKYDQAFLTTGISDLRGIKNDVEFDWGGQTLNITPGSRISELSSSGFTHDLPSLESQLGKSIGFQFELDLQGSGNLSFVPTGKITRVDLSSNWSTPSFSGMFLPDNRDVTDEGFEASWLVLELNRNFPQHWIGDRYFNNLIESAFGVDLLIPLNNYQKSYRSVKYAAMTIALTFLIFFLVEALNKRKIHPFQYILVGLTLCLFYVLFVSISEHSNFNLAYALSTLAVIVIISFYSLTIFKARRMTWLLVLALSGIYGFMFVTIQLVDYSLLIGSLGLMVILSATMYFTRNINWYKLSINID